MLAASSNSLTRRRKCSFSEHLHEWKSENRLCTSDVTMNSFLFVVLLFLVLFCCFFFLHFSQNNLRFHCRLHNKCKQMQCAVAPGAHKASDCTSMQCRVTDIEYPISKIPGYSIELASVGWREVATSSRYPIGFRPVCYWGLPNESKRDETTEPRSSIPLRHLKSSIFARTLVLFMYSDFVMGAIISSNTRLKVPSVNWAESRANPVNER